MISHRLSREVTTFSFICVAIDYPRRVGTDDEGGWVVWGRNERDIIVQRNSQTSSLSVVIWVPTTNGDWSWEATAASIVTACQTYSLVAVSHDTCGGARAISCEREPATLAPKPACPKSQWNSLSCRPLNGERGLRKGLRNCPLSGVVNIRWSRSTCSRSSLQSRFGMTSYGELAVNQIPLLTELAWFDSRSSVRSEQL